MSKARLISSDAFALLTRGGPPLCSVGVVSKVLISLSERGIRFIALADILKGNDLACSLLVTDHHPRHNAQALVHAAGDSDPH